MASNSTKPAKAARTAAGRPSAGMFRLVRLATYALITSEMLLLAVATHQAWLVAVGPLVGLLHWLLTRNSRRLILRTELVSMFSVVAVLFVLFAFRKSLAAGVIGISVFFVFVQVLLLFRLFNPREQRLVQVAALFQLVAISIMTTDLAFILAFVLFVASFCFHLIAFEMNSLDLDVRTTDEDAETPPQRRVPALRYFLRAVAFVSHVLLLLTVVLFLLFPRFKTGMLAGPIDLSSVTEIGFSDHMQLGDVGKLLESREVVMRVRISHPDGRKLRQVLPVMLLRGKVLDVYRKGSWYSYTDLPDISYTPQITNFGSSVGEWTYLRQRMSQDQAFRPGLWTEVSYEIYLEPLDSPVLFSIYRPVKAWLPSGIPWGLDTLNSEIISDRARATRIKYRMTSIVPTSRANVLKYDQVHHYAAQFYLDVSPALREVLDEKLTEIRDLYKPKTDLQMAEAIERFLKSSGEYGYTLERPPMGTRDPMIGFLDRIKAGHCEYFASAMVLLCRAADIPARLVVGFKGGEYDRKSMMFIVRQKHAHAWVEVKLASAGWTWFDPTTSLPPKSKEPRKRRSSSSGSFFRGNWFGDFITSKWVTNVVGYDQEEQKQFLVEMVQTIQFLIRTTKAVLKDLVPKRPSVYRLLVPGFVFTVVVLGLLLYRGIGWIERRLLVKRPLKYHQRATLKFYNEVLKILSRKGLYREHCWTPREYYALVEAAVTGVAEDISNMKKGLLFATNLYYDVRYGGRPITQDEISETRRVLKLLARWKPRRDFRLTGKAPNGIRHR